jgi:hypothetical protein
MLITVVRASQLRQRGLNRTSLFDVFEVVVSYMEL